MQQLPGKAWGVRTAWQAPAASCIGCTPAPPRETESPSSSVALGSRFTHTSFPALGRQCRQRDEASKGAVGRLVASRAADLAGCVEHQVHAPTPHPHLSTAVSATFRIQASSTMISRTSSQGLAQAGWSTSRPKQTKTAMPETQPYAM